MTFHYVLGKLTYNLQSLIAFNLFIFSMQHILTLKSLDLRFLLAITGIL